MPPKKSGVRLRQSGAVFVSLAYHAIVGTRVVPPGIFPCLIKNRPGFRSCHRYKVRRASTFCVQELSLVAW